MSQKRQSRIEIYFESFASRLRELRRDKGFSGEVVASKLGHGTKSTISRWETRKEYPDIRDLVSLSEIYEVSLSKLVGNIEQGSQPENPWLSYIRTSSNTESLPLDVSTDVERGISILNALNNHKSIEEICQLDELQNLHGNRKEVFALLRSALVSGEVIFSKVLMNTELETKIVEKYPQLLNFVHVVDLSNTDITEALPPELVAWVAAEEVMPKLRQASKVGFGFGYTLHRMCLLTPPSVNQFRGTKWLPLMAYSGQEDITATSANHHAALMEQRHYFSNAVPLKYFPPNERTNTSLQEIRRNWEALDIALVSGFGWSRKDNFRITNSYREIFDRIENAGKRGSIVGEFLGHILDTDGNAVHEGDADLVTTRIPLVDIQRCAQEGRVYFIGYGMQKAPIVKVVLEKGYINGLITDSGLAKELLK